jgi:putative lipoprotein (rSAM/lipoprotein system)
MAPIQLKFLKSTNSLIILLISILGFSLSCKKEEQRYMYGSPSSDYIIIKGKIESAENNQTIPDIIIELRGIASPESESAGTQLLKTGFSDAAGTYKLWDPRGYPFLDTKTYQIKFTDMDGALNGEYETLDTTIAVQDPKIKDENGAIQGTIEKEMNIKLKPKK